MGPVACCYFRDIGDEPEPFARDRPDQPLLLAAIADRLAHRIDMAGEGRFGDDPPAPDRIQQIVLADDARAVLDQMSQQVEDLRPDRHHRLPPRQLPPLGVEHIASEQELHVGAPIGLGHPRWRGRSWDTGPVPLPSRGTLA